MILNEINQKYYNAKMSEVLLQNPTNLAKLIVQYFEKKGLYMDSAKRDTGSYSTFYSDIRSWQYESSNKGALFVFHKDKAGNIYFDRITVGFDKGYIHVLTKNKKFKTSINKTVLEFLDLVYEKITSDKKDSPQNKVELIANLFKKYNLDAQSDDSRNQVYIFTKDYEYIFKDKKVARIAKKYFGTGLNLVAKEVIQLFEKIAKYSIKLMMKEGYALDERSTSFYYSSESGIALSFQKHISKKENDSLEIFDNKMKNIYKHDIKSVSEIRKDVSRAIISDLFKENDMGKYILKSFGEN